MQQTRTDAAAQRSDSATAVDTLKDRAWTLLHEREAEGRDGYSDKDDDAKREEAKRYGLTSLFLATDDEQAIKEIIRDNVVLYEGKYNDIGQSLNGRHNPFSKGWFDKASPSVIKTVKGNLNSYFRNHLDAKSEDIIWTTFGSMKKKGKGVRGKIQGKGYSKSFISNNTKATNNYIDKIVVAYMQNTFYHPTVKNYFTDRNVVVHDDLYSLSEMVQLIWRSRIRKNEKIFVYIPSSRMRYLFKAWLVSNNAQELAEEISANKQDGIFLEKGRKLFV